MSTKTIAVIDDDIHIGNMLEEALQAKGYLTLRAYSGTEALMLLSVKKPDLVLLDLMLPGLSGEELLPQIKDIPVIVVSAKADIPNKVELLMNGAEDYITKPFDINELLARIAVQLRKKSRSSDSLTLTYKLLTLHTDTMTAEANGQVLKLTRTEYAILKLLMTNPEQVVAKLTILDKISLDTPDCTEDSLKVHVHNLRKKLKNACGKEYVEAVWGIGFMLKENLN